MSATAAAAAAAALASRRNSARNITGRNNTYNTNNQHYLSFSPILPRYNCYETQKHQDWNTFDQYLKNYHHCQPPPCMRRCSVSHVLQFLKYLDQFGETKIHNMRCKYYGQTHPPAACSCPIKKAWSGLEAVAGRLRVAFEEHGGSPETNPFRSRAVVLYIKQVKECQAKARGLAN